MNMATPLLVVICLSMVGCTAPTYLSVAPADPVDQDRRLAPSRPAQAVVRDQHLGQLQVEFRFLEEALFRAEQKRLNVCQQPEAALPSSLAYHRCQFADRLYERLKDEVARAREQYLRAVSASGGSSR